ncbi:outer membrane beta-barrel protein [Butyricimonas paravirosa]|uniref:outer membrane beta-barrel protein n=1 Tax=Butyricimonas paravirosa TaxID=1472417 RepID=UPI00210E9078|nr:outer membrane beta-barrel protein [Butyricimonas paravirosa]MCQ4874936.1 PorT family protein [Butyricimonas paravirosa]
MSEKIEKLFKNALEQVSVEPPSRVWEGINSHFAMKQRRMRRIYTYSGVAAAVLLLFCVGYFMQNQHANIYTPSSIVALNFDNNQDSNKILAFTSTSHSIPEIKKRIVQYSNKNLVPVPTSTSVWEGLENEQPEGDLKNNAIRSEFIPLVNQSAIENQRKYTELLEGKSSIPVKTTKVKSENEAKIFSVGGYISPGYSSGNYRTSGSNTRSAQYESSQMSGILNIGGGLTFAVKPTKRISIETGLGYSRLGEKTDDAQVYVPSGDMVSYNANTHAYTPLGSVKNKATATVSTPENFISLKGEQDKEGSIEQQFDAIEIPLIFRYHLNDNKVRFSVLGGFGASFMVRNHTYVNYNGKKEFMGEAEDIRTFNISTNIGFGIEYPITKSIAIKLEPGFKYYLQSLSKSEFIDFKPYSFTFSTGIGINF